MCYRAKADKVSCRLLLLIDKRERSPHTAVAEIDCYHQDCLARYRQPRHSTRSRKVGRKSSFHEIVRWFYSRCKTGFHPRTTKFYLHSIPRSGRGKPHPLHVVDSVCP